MEFLSSATFAAHPRATFVGSESSLLKEIGSLCGGDQQLCRYSPSFAVDFASLDSIVQDVCFIVLHAGGSCWDMWLQSESTRRICEHVTRTMHKELRFVVCPVGDAKRQWRVPDGRSAAELREIFSPYWNETLPILVWDASREPRVDPELFTKQITSITCSSPTAAPTPSCSGTLSLSTSTKRRAVSVLIGLSLLAFLSYSIYKLYKFFKELRLENLDLKNQLLKQQWESQQAVLEKQRLTELLTAENQHLRGENADLKMETQQLHLEAAAQSEAHEAEVLGLQAELQAAKWWPTSRWAWVSWVSRLF